MGQYYMTVNLDKKQCLDPHKFGDGAKLMEFALSDVGMMAGLGILLADGNGRGGGDLRSENPIIGSWAGDRIVIAGDYADQGKFLEKDQGERTLNDVSSEYEDISQKVIEALKDDSYAKDTMEKRGAATQ